MWCGVEQGWGVADVPFTASSPRCRGLVEGNNLIYGPSAGGDLVLLTCPLLPT